MRESASSMSTQEWMNFEMRMERSPTLEADTGNSVAQYKLAFYLTAAATTTMSDLSLFCTGEPILSWIFSYILYWRQNYWIPACILQRYGRLVSRKTR